MKISSTGLTLIKKFEGCELTAYQDIAGVWTIGYGHTGSDVTPGKVISAIEVEELLRKDVSFFEKGVTEALKVPVNQNQFDALVSFSYNVGLGAFKESTLLKLLNDKTDKNIVAAEFSRWSKADGVVVQGLLNRRKDEQALFLTSVKNAVLAHSILAQQDTWLKRKPAQANALTPEEKLFVPKGAAHEWKSITIVPGESDYKVVLEAQPDQIWWFYPSHWKIINDIAPKSIPTQVQHSSKLILDVPYYSQRDNVRDPLRTCFSSSCGMLLKYLKPNSIKSDDEYIVTVFKYGDTTDAGAQIEALAHYGVEAAFRQNGDWSDIDSQLIAGIPVPIGILHHGPVGAPVGGGHWIIIVGRNEKNDAYIVNDPNGELDLVNGNYLSSNGKQLVYSKKNLGPRWKVEGASSGWFIKAKK